LGVMELVMRYAPVLLALLLPACGNSGLTRDFSLSRDSGPQTVAATQVPLSVPPGLIDRPTNAGALPTDQGSVPAATEQNPGSAGQEALMQAAGPPPEADIRAAINQNSGLVYPDPQFIDSVLNWTPQPGYATIFTQPHSGWFSGLF